MCKSHPNLWSCTLVCLYVTQTKCSFIMPKRHVFFYPEEGFVSKQSKAVPVTEWELCTLCQTKSCQNLQCPTIKRFDVGSGHVSLARDLSAFQELERNLAGKDFARPSRRLSISRSDASAARIGWVKHVVLHVTYRTCCAHVLYNRTSDALQVNEARKRLFTTKCRALESIPPTKAVLEQHVKRAFTKHISGIMP